MDLCVRLHLQTEKKSHSSLLGADEDKYTKYSATEEPSNIIYVITAAKIASQVPLQLYRCSFDLVSLGWQ